MNFQLNQAKANVGAERFKALISTIDESIINNLKEYNINLMD